MKQVARLAVAVLVLLVVLSLSGCGGKESGTGHTSTPHPVLHADTEPFFLGGSHQQPETCHPCPSVGCSLVLSPFQPKPHAGQVALKFGVKLSL
jgi:hypothetical protein